MNGAKQDPATLGVAVFSPTPLVTVTIEAGEDGPDLHVHAGGQGVWVARMLHELGTDVRLVIPLGGETGQLLGPLLSAEGLRADTFTANGTTGAYVHDRRRGERHEVANMPPTPLTRHAMDELYGGMLAAAATSRVCVLTGASHAGVLPDETYRRLARDLRALGAKVVADLCGATLDEALEGGVDVIKVSHSELVSAGRAQGDSVPELLEAMHEMRAEGAGAVVVSRADRPTLAMVDENCVQVAGPVLQRVDHRGGGDSMTAGIAAALAAELPMREALRLGFAAGALNVTRHGLATGQREAIESIAERVSVQPVDSPAATS